MMTKRTKRFLYPILAILGILFVLMFFAGKASLIPGFTFQAMTVFEKIVSATPEELAFMTERCKEVYTGASVTYYACGGDDLAATTITSTAQTCDVHYTKITSCSIDTSCTIDSGYQRTNPSRAYCKPIPKSTSAGSGDTAETATSQQGVGTTQQTRVEKPKTPDYTQPISGVSIPKTLSGGNLDFSKAQPLPGTDLIDPITHEYKGPGAETTPMVTTKDGFQVITQKGRQVAFKGTNLMKISSMPLLANGSCVTYINNMCPKGTSCVSAFDLEKRGLITIPWFLKVASYIAILVTDTPFIGGAIAVSFENLDFRTSGFCIDELPPEDHPTIDDPKLSEEEKPGGVTKEDLKDCDGTPDGIAAILLEHTCTTNNDCQKGNECLKIRTLEDAVAMSTACANQLSAEKRSQLSQIGWDIGGCAGGILAGAGTKKVARGYYAEPLDQSKKNLKGAIKELSGGTGRAANGRFSSSKLAKTTKKAGIYGAGLLTLAEWGVECYLGGKAGNELGNIVDNKKTDYGVCVNEKDAEEIKKSLPSGGGGSPTNPFDVVKDWVQSFVSKTFGLNIGDFFSKLLTWLLAGFMIWLLLFKLLPIGLGWLKKR